MKITLLAHGKTDVPFFRDALEFYSERIKHYVGYTCIEIPSPKIAASATRLMVMEKEAGLAEKYFRTGNHIILLDEKGKEYSSVKFAGLLQAKMNAGIKDLVFMTGGPYGFSDRIYARAHEKMALSQMTLPHQMARVIFAEQLYRAFSILRNESYHHE